MAAGRDTTTAIWSSLSTLAEIVYDSANCASFEAVEWVMVKESDLDDRLSNDLEDVGGGGATKFATLIDFQVFSWLFGSQILQVS